MISCLGFIVLFSGQAPEVESLYSGCIESMAPIPLSQEIEFIGLPGQRYPRWIGCEFKKLCTIGVASSYNYRDRVFSEDAVTALKQRAREIGGDAVLFFRGSTSGIEAQVVRRVISDCEPFLLFLEQPGHDTGEPVCEYRQLGPPLSGQLDLESVDSGYWEIVTGAFADSVRARSGEALCVTSSEGTVTGRVVRFVDPGCREWIE